MYATRNIMVKEDVENAAQHPSIRLCGKEIYIYTNKQMK